MEERDKGGRWRGRKTRPLPNEIFGCGTALTCFSCYLIFFITNCLTVEVTTE